MGVIVTVGAVLAIQVLVVFAMLACLALPERKSKLVSWCFTVLLVMWVGILALDSVKH